MINRRIYIVGGIFMKKRNVSMGIIIVLMLSLAIFTACSSDKSQVNNEVNDITTEVNINVITIQININFLI